MFQAGSGGAGFEVASEKSGPVASDAPGLAPPQYAFLARQQPENNSLAAQTAIWLRLDLIRHLDRLIGRLGDKGVALGSDFDEAMMPELIGDASGLPHLIAAMQAAGYGDTLIRRLCRDNWPDLLRRVIG